MLEKKIFGQTIKLEDIGIADPYDNNISKMFRWMKALKLKKNANKGIKVDLDIGDMLVYRGCDLEHWREPFKKKEAAQVFLHYNSKDTPYAEQNIFDARVHLGLPQWFKGRK